MVQRSFDRKAKNSNLTAMVLQGCWKMRESSRLQETRKSRQLMVNQSLGRVKNPGLTATMVQGCWRRLESSGRLVKQKSRQLRVHLSSDQKAKSLSLTVMMV
jgi:hypothetical protein